MFKNFFRPFFKKYSPQPIDIFLEHFKSVHSVGNITQAEMQTIYTAISKTQRSYPTYHLQLLPGKGVGFSFMDYEKKVVSIGYDGFDSHDDIAFMVYHELRHVQQHELGYLNHAFNIYGHCVTLWKDDPPFIDFRPATNNLHASFPHEIDANDYALSFFESEPNLKNKDVKEILYYHRIHKKKRLAA